MSFRSRMTQDTGAPMPRFLYLLLKPVECLAGGIALAAVAGWSSLWTTVGVAAFYTLLGLVLWYRGKRVVVTLAPGQLAGDAWYHGLLSAAAIPFVLPVPPVVRLALFVVCAALWWVSDTAGYGVVRSPDGSPVPTP